MRAWGWFENTTLAIERARGEPVGRVRGCPVDLARPSSRARRSRDSAERGRPFDCAASSAAHRAAPARSIACDDRVCNRCSGRDCRTVLDGSAPRWVPGLVEQCRPRQRRTPGCRSRTAPRRGRRTPACTGCSSPSAASPSTVTIVGAVRLAPPGTRHDITAAPSRCTVHAPHSPSAQPSLVPVQTDGRRAASRAAWCLQRRRARRRRRSRWHVISSVGRQLVFAGGHGSEQRRPTAGRAPVANARLVAVGDGIKAAADHDLDGVGSDTRRSHARRRSASPLRRPAAAAAIARRRAVVRREPRRPRERAPRWGPRCPARCRAALDGRRRRPRTRRPTARAPPRSPARCGFRA